MESVRGGVPTVDGPAHNPGNPQMRAAWLAWIRSQAPRSPFWQWVGLSLLWEDIVGRPLARVSRPYRLHQRVLTIEVQGSGWLHEMRQHADILRDRIHRVYPWCRFDRIEFRLCRSRKRPSDPGVPPLQSARLPSELATWIQDIARSIPDIRIRRRFIRACRAYWHHRLNESLCR